MMDCSRASLWLWPDPVEFSLGRRTPDAAWAIGALDRLRELDLQAANPPRPIMVSLAFEAHQMIEDFGREMQERKETAGGLLRTASGQARGQALRLVAMGAMICERGQAVPIILDDALVFSDDDRIGQMFDALNRAGQKQQVIVLTCRTRAFAALGGRQLSISSSAPKAMFG
jgi:hypothetical protein